MKTALDSQNKTLTLAITGDLISSKAERLRPEINALLEPPADAPAQWTQLRLDLTGAKMVDSVGLNFIVSILKAVQKQSARMQILYSNQNVYRTFLFTRLDKHIELVKA